MRRPTEEEKELRATIIELMVWVRENTMILPSAYFKTFDDAFCFAEALLRKTAWMDEEDKTESTVTELVRRGILIDGGHHKQYFLVEIAQKLGIDLKLMDYDKGIPP